MAKSLAMDTVIIDTAGRLSVDEQMMDEIANIKDAIKPDEILFVVDSMTGQDAVNTAKAFNDRIDFDGVVLTKLDGDTRGGAALSIKSVVDKPIKFVSTGEKLDALSPFYLTVWLSVSWGWVMWFHSLKKLKKNLMPKKQIACRNASALKNSIWKIFWIKFKRSKRWGTLPTSSR